MTCRTPQRNTSSTGLTSATTTSPSSRWMSTNRSPVSSPFRRGVATKQQPSPRRITVVWARHIVSVVQRLTQLAFVVAFLSIVQSLFTNDDFRDNNRKPHHLRRITTTTTEKPRTVWLQGNYSDAHKQPHTHSTSRYKFSMPLLYPLRTSNGTHQPPVVIVDDPTRYYSHADSSRDFPHMERRAWPHHEVDPHCKPMYEWQSQFYPICNSIHETHFMTELQSRRLSILSSKGFWRHAWKLWEEPPPEWYWNNMTESMATISSNNSTQNKTLSEWNMTATVWRTLKIEHAMEEAFFEFNRVDAVAMERLTASPFVINIYAFCGMSVVTEYAPKELHTVAGKMNSTERLRLATQVAQGVADIHSIGRTISLVHNDINLANLVITQNNQPALNDFNVAILLMKHNETGETCPFLSHFPNPQWRAPEEQVYSEDESNARPPLVTEKVDIYALGNVLYRLAVNTSPWKQSGEKKLSVEEKDQVARLKRGNGTTPTVPEHISNSTDQAVQAMLTAMKWAFRFNPMERPSATTIFEFLKASLERIDLEERHGLSNVTAKPHGHEK